MALNKGKFGGFGFSRAMMGLAKARAVRVCPFILFRALYGHGAATGESRHGNFNSAEPDMSLWNRNRIENERDPLLVAFT